MKKLFINFRLAGRVAAFVVVTFSFWMLLELERLLRRKTPHIQTINKWVSLWAQAILKIFGIHITANGKHVSEGKLYPSEGNNGIGRIFVANHRSGMDIPIILATAEAHVISRHDIATWPLVGQSARRAGTLFVDRSSRRSGALVLRAVDNALHRGEGVAMFPEGTSHVGDEVHEFQPGAFNAASRANAEIVPIGLAYEGEDAYFFNESFMTHMKRVASLPKLHVAIEIGEPLSSADYSSVELKEVAHQRVQELVEKCRNQLTS